MNSLTILAKGGGGGGGRASSGGGSRGSSSKGSAGAKSSPAPTPAAPKSGTSKAAPGSKVKTSDGKEVQSSTKKPTNSKYTESKGVVGDNGYSPRFNNGYSAPAGSVVYYPQHSALDYLPWIYLFSQNSPAKDQATIVQPDGKEMQAQPVQEGGDGLAVLNWFILIVMALAIVGGIIWGVNKVITKREEKKLYGSHGI